ncbi:hypothetical protein BDZ97DRAFT_1872657, partial [Flammula alnicola]
MSIRVRWVDVKRIMDVKRIDADVMEDSKRAPNRRGRSSVRAGFRVYDAFADDFVEETESEAVTVPSYGSLAKRTSRELKLCVDTGNEFDNKIGSARSTRYVARESNVGNVGGVYGTCAEVGIVVVNEISEEYEWDMVWIRNINPSRAFHSAYSLMSPRRRGWSVLFL